MILVIKTFAIFLVIVASSPLLAKPGKNLWKNMELIGSIEGKTFYSDKTQSRNWFQARDFCNASGLELAAIETQNQYDMLVYNGSNGGGAANHWTAGRDAHLARQFTWDTTNTQPIDTFDWFTYQPYQTCVQIYIGKDFTNGRVYMSPCTETQRGTLCQTKT